MYLMLSYATKISLSGIFTMLLHFTFQFML
nr:MAG TPA: hypothetical protein [Bacteriophage sp.]